MHMSHYSFEQVIEFLQKDKRVPLLIIVVLFLWMLSSLWQFWQAAQFGRSNQNTVSSALALPTTPNINQWHLFGLYNASLADLPQTQLQLNLQGTIVSVKSPQNSYALISADGQTAKIYHIDDRLPGDAILKNIFKDSVVLEYNGQLQSLKIPIPLLQGITDVANA